MRYTEVLAAIHGVTGPEGPFPLVEQLVDGVPRQVFDGLPENLRDYYAYAASFGDKDCIVDRDRRFSFTDVVGRAGALADLLSDRYGVKKGDRVAIAMRNSPEWCLAFMAITSLGAVAVPLNSWWQGDELAYGLQDSGSSHVILDAQRYERLAYWLPGSGLTVIGTDREGRGLPPDVDRLDDLLTGASNAALQAVKILPDDPAVILYTSGSTGQPKGVLSTHRNVLSAIGTWLVVGTAIAVLEGTVGQEPEIQPAILLSVPLFHVTGLNSLFLFSLGIGRKIVMMHKWNIDDALELIQAERITNFNGVPTMSMELTNHPRLGEYDTSSLVEIASGGATRPADQVAAIVERFPGSYPSAGYGLTETNAVGCLIGEEEYVDRPASVGQPTPPLVEVRIIGEDGEPVPNGQSGEICLRSPAVVSGYLNQPDATADAFRDGWFRTGDVGYLDDEGFLFIVDRIKDIIIRGGENISCTEVEEAMYAHPDVVEAAVFALPDEHLGEIVGAAIATQPGSSLDATKLQTFLAERLAAFKIPVHIRVEDHSLPKIASGKIFKKQIREEFASQLGFSRSAVAEGG
jgi:acyl-CoA synthetase (AMP-forming)/AMP-acid ligase II